jgi:hypothetical protein
MKPQALSFSKFLTALFQSFDEEGLRPCVLRNYEEFPASNVGSDVDFLVRRSELPRIVRAVRSIRGIRIVGYAERHYVAHLFVEGVSSTPGVRALELDFIWSLNWKGLEYLATDAVLQTATVRQAGDLTFLVPSPVHEAIISLLSSLLIGGWLKEKYFPKVQQTFTNNRLEVTAALLQAFGTNAATQLVDSAIAGDRQEMLSCVKPLRISLVRRSLMNRPSRSVFAVARYHLREFAVRCTPATLETVCISGLDNSVRETILTGLTSMLRNSAKLVERRHFGSRLKIGCGLSQNDASEGSFVEGRCRQLVSISRMIRWVVEEWISRFMKRDNLTLWIDESCFSDLLIDTWEHRKGISRWFERLIGNLLPSLDLWVLLDGAGEVMESQKEMVKGAKSAAQPKNHTSFVKTRNRHIILNAGRPAPIVEEEVYAAIVEALAQRTEEALDRRF